MDAMKRAIRAREITILRTQKLLQEAKSPEMQRVFQKEIERLKAKPIVPRMPESSPQNLLDMTIVAGYHIEAGSRKFVDFVAKMVESLGEWVIPYLKGLYENIRYYPGMETIAKDMDTVQFVAGYSFDSKDLDQDKAPQEVIKPSTSITATAKAVTEAKRKKKSNAPNNLGPSIFDNDNKDNVSLQEKLTLKTTKMATDRNEELKKRVLKWEATAGRKLESLNQEEWIEAMSEIMAMTRAEAEEYLMYLWQKKETNS